MGTSTTGFKQMKKIVLALSAAMVLAACSQDQAAPPPAAAPAPVAAAPAPATQTATVTATTLSLRASASTRARRVATLRRGTEVQVMDVNGNWAHVMAGSSEGYVQKNYLRM
jgi:2',3'-cyclic-nucleotide 2'-phosphodiesterase/3'-nucleotidase